MSEHPKFLLAALALLVGSLGVIVWYFVSRAEQISLIIDLPSWAIYATLSPILIIPGVLGIKVAAKFNSHLGYDDIRKKDLEKLKFGFRAYFQDHGYYPTSNLGEEYNKKPVRIPGDWNLYQFPDHEKMWKYIQGWPLHDPSFNHKNPGRSKYYLYLLSPDHKHFSVYVSLDGGDKGERKDYNAADGISTGYGNYNYKVGY